MHCNAFVSQKKAVENFLQHKIIERQNLMQYNLSRCHYSRSNFNTSPTLIPNSLAAPALISRTNEMFFGGKKVFG